MAETTPEADDFVGDKNNSSVNKLSETFESFSMNGDFSKTVHAEDEKEDEILYAVADFNGHGEDQLTLQKMEPLKVLDKTSDHWWWMENAEGKMGYVPVNHMTFQSTQQIYWQDEEYFSSYENLKLHHEMLSDHPRTLAYQTAIQNNAQLLNDKVILDVGCGTGILSLMCAKYGNPKQVYAVEASDLDPAEVVRTNNLSHVITVFNSYVENIQLNEQVDLIISEWMGTLLLFEMMIESVIIAREKYLKPGGSVWPSSATLFLVPVTAEDRYKDCIDFWDDQYGFDLSCLKSQAAEEFLDKPCHSYRLSRDDCLAAETKVLELDMLKIKAGDLEKIVHPFEFKISRSGTLHGFCTWFQVDFCGLSPEIAANFLNTGPDFELTHWKQNLFMLNRLLQVKQGDVLHGEAIVFRHRIWRRHLRLQLSFSHWCCESQKTVDSISKVWNVWR